MISVIAIVGVVLLLCIGLRLLWRCCWTRRLKGLLEAVEGYVVQFTCIELQKVTKNFSEKIRSGGFSTIFKGTFPVSTVVAGDKQFRNKVSTLVINQHVNLVHLHGFCFKGSKRLLVYNYMPNGSLDHHLFHGNVVALNWRRRFAIILGLEHPPRRGLLTKGGGHGRGEAGSEGL
ncbi:hypothetical protein Taro_003912 [Colocasia esculenta]|uniref:Serine-threonine/tyrosine-protein kinase catalytic domain-containing protein n=1 Tax=Colocasia esculenta TaxID=4460 RepID=A0A843TQ57_COLES|nr:hypothetical protein [Colocasia esculenta]